MMTTDSVLDHDPAGVVAPLPVEVVDVVEPETVEPETVEPDFEALLERERERLADAERRLDEVLLTTVFDGQGRTIEKAEAAVAIARRRIRSLELRRQSAADTAEARKQAARRVWIEEVAAEVDDTIAELSERCRVFVECVETAKSALRDAAAVADKIRLQRRSVRLRANNGELEAFETGRSLPTFGVLQLLEKAVAVNVLDLATAYPGVAVHAGITGNAVTLARPIPRGFEVPLARVRRGFAIDPAVALRATGKFGGQRPAGDDDAD